jgi:hypothetical protein
MVVEAVGTQETTVVEENALSRQQRLEAVDGNVSRFARMLMPNYATVTK